MNREIKFRIFWEGKMDYDPCEGYGSPISINNTLSRDNVMQFTGRKDKNDKDIFEGDIVKFTAFWNDQPTKKDEHIEVMNWVDLSEYGEYDYSGYNFHHWRTSNIETIEVIGNIYENPDLIPHE